MNQMRRTIDKNVFFRALADRTRLRILNLMRGEEVCVCFFVEVLKTHQPNAVGQFHFMPEPTTARERLWVRVIK